MGRLNSRITLLSIFLILFGLSCRAYSQSPAETMYDSIKAAELEYANKSRLRQNRNTRSGVQLSAMPGYIGSFSFTGEFKQFSDEATFVFWRETVDGAERLFLKVIPITPEFWFCAAGGQFSILQNEIDYSDAFRATRGDDISVCEELSETEILLVDQWPHKDNFKENQSFTMTFRETSDYYSGSLSVTSSVAESETVSDTATEIDSGIEIEVTPVLTPVDTSVSNVLKNPVGANVYPFYEAIVSPVVVDSASSSLPVAVGSIADRGEMLDLKVQLNNLETPANLYLALIIPELDPHTIFLFTEEGGITPLTDKLLPWKRGVSSINETTVLADIPTATLPFADYQFYLFQIPQNSDDFLSNFNLWSTSISTKPQVIETEDPEMPAVIVNQDGSIITFRVDGNTKNLTGISFDTQDGEQGFLAINAQSGLPDSWYSDNTLLLYENIRVDEALMDLGVVYPDGSTAYLNDLTMDKVLLALQDSRSNNQKRDFLPKVVGALNLAEKVGTVMSAAACGASIIVTGGTALAGVASFIAPPVSGAFFTIAVTATGVAMTCSTALIGLAAMKAENTDAVDASNALKQVGLPEDVLECISAGAPSNTKTILIAKALHCLKALSDAASLEHGKGLVKYSKAIEALQAGEVSVPETEVGFPTESVCPKTLDVNNGVFSANIITRNFKSFADTASIYKKICQYKDTSAQIYIYFSPDHPHGACGQTNGPVWENSILNSTERTIEVYGFTDSSESIPDYSKVITTVLNGAVAQSAGSKCEP